MVVTIIDDRTSEVGTPVMAQNMTEGNITGVNMRNSFKVI
jgi:hypothetical protein